MADIPRAGSASDVTCTLHEWFGLRTELLFVYDQSIPAGSANRKGERDVDFSAWLVRKGWARVVADGEAYRAEAGQWLICFGRNIEQELSPDVHLLSLRVQQAWPDDTPLFGRKAGCVLDADVHPRLERLARPLVRRAEQLSWDSGTKDPRDTFLSMSGLTYPAYLRYQIEVLSWMAELSRVLLASGFEIRVPSRRDPRLGRAFRVLHACGPADPCPEADVCQASGLSSGHLNRLCVQDYGFTIHAYWEKRRMTYAREALERPGARVKMVASELGFVQLSHFSAWFKRKTGLSPRAYQKRVHGL